MLETIIAVIMSFAGTNIDDMFINTLFFAQADTKNKIKSIIIGKYLGIGILVSLSCLGAFFLHSVPQKYFAYLGLVPIALGIKECIVCIKSRKHPDSESSEEKSDLSKGLLLNVTLITVSNGADNIGVYMPLFAGYSIFQMTAVLVVFSVMIALWCFLGRKLSDLPGLRDILLKYKYIMVPFIYVALGIYIIIKFM